MNIGENIRKYRKMRGLTQAELAKKVELSEITIKGFEANKFKPRLDTLQKIANAFGVSMGCFFPEYSAEDFEQEKATADEKVLPHLGRKAERGNR